MLCASTQQSYCRQGGVRHPTVHPSVVRPSSLPVFAETVKRIKFQILTKAISPPYLQAIFSSVDYVSRAHVIEIHPPSVRVAITFIYFIDQYVYHGWDGYKNCILPQRPAIIFLYPMRRFLLNFSLTSPVPHTQTLFEFLKKKNNKKKNKTEF